MKKIILCILIILILLAWIGFPYFGIIKCPYKASTGNPCAFCGTMTSFSSAVQGHIREAMHINPVGVFVFGMVLVSGCFLIYRILK
jgi:hypothetical protein